MATAYLIWFSRLIGAIYSLVSSPVFMLFTVKSTSRSYLLIPYDREILVLHDKDSKKAAKYEWFNSKSWANLFVAFRRKSMNKSLLVAPSQWLGYGDARTSGIWKPLKSLFSAQLVTEASSFSSSCRWISKLNCWYIHPISANVNRIVHATSLGQISLLNCWPVGVLTNIKQIIDPRQ